MSVKPGQGHTSISVTTVLTTTRRRSVVREARERAERQPGEHGGQDGDEEP